MHNKLHAAAFIKETFSNNGIGCGDSAQYGAAGNNVFNGLLRAGIIQPAFALEPRHGVQHFRRFLIDEAGHGVGREIANFLAQLADLSRKFFRASWRFAQPERD